MADIIATCGHHISWEWNADPHSLCAVKITTCEGGWGVSYGVLCPECRALAERDDDLLMDELAVDMWFNEHE